MKRLLAYLFIVLGLGLMVNVSAEVEGKKPIKTLDKNIYVYDKSSNAINLFSTKCYSEWGLKKKHDCTNYDGPVERAIALRFASAHCKSYNKSTIGIPKTTIKVTHFNKPGFSRSYKCINFSNETQIAKAEPSQTYEVDTYIRFEMIAKVFDDQYSESGQANTFFTFFDTQKTSLKDKKSINNFYKYVFKKTIDKCKRLNKTFVEGVCAVTSVKFRDLNNSKNNKLIVNKKGFKTSSLFYDLINEFNTQIAKAEPSQNKEVSKLVLICEAKYKGKKGYRVFKTTSQILSEALPIINSKKCFAILEENEKLFSQANKFSIPNFIVLDDFLRVANDVSRNFYDTHPKLAELTKSSKFSFDGSYVSFKNKFPHTQIAKAEPSQTQKIVDDELFANSKINNLDKINVNQYENGFGVYLNENDRLVFNIKKKEARIEYNLNKKNPHIFRIIEINDEYIKMEQTYVNFKYAYNDGSCNSRCWKKFEKRKNESGEFATYLSMTFSLKDGKLNKIYYPSSQKPEIENKNILSKIKNIIAKPFVYTKDFFLEIKDNKIVSKFKDNKTAEYLSENKKELIEIIFWAAITYYALDEGFGKDLFKSNSSSSTSSLVKPKIGSDLSKGGYHYTYNGSATLLRTLKSLRVYGF
ncbi:hypothetical protein N9C51_02975 [Candidatus Pelagibacter sp.]|nr:hypothetical protein [Candidatus Pelagibacter sp.]